MLLGDSTMNLIRTETHENQPRQFHEAGKMHVTNKCPCKYS